MFSGGGIFDSGKNSDSITDTDTTSYASVNELWTASDGFNITNMKTLFNMLANKTKASLKDIEALGTKTAADIRANTTGKTSSQDIVVTLGGLKWEVVYLSKDTDGNTILTLWLSNNKQSAWTSKSATEGTYYGFLDGGLYSDYAANWTSSTISTYPSDMYGTSYIRAVALNNGGKYSTSATAAKSAIQTTNNVFASFTMSSSTLCNYIVTPAKVSWQENQSTIESAGFTYNLSNDAWSKTTSNTGFYSTSLNYATKTNSDTWKNDKIWLPSMAETGYRDSNLGLWKVSEAQRQNADGVSGNANVGDVGSTAGAAYNYAWLRSGGYNGASYSHTLVKNGAGFDDGYTDKSYAVRPAFHLNLSKIAKDFMDDWSFYAATSYASGSGSKVNPYRIATAEQLAYLATKKAQTNLYVKQVADINLGGHKWVPINFWGHYDGGGYKISDINIDSTDHSQGLFGSLGMGGEILNVNITDGYINSTGECVGGIVGTIGEGTVSGCRSNARVNGRRNVGGIAGYDTGDGIENCINTGNITGTVENVGGIVGSGRYVSNCFNYGDVTGGQYVGGIAGTSNGSVSNCISNAVIAGDDCVGSILGDCFVAIENCAGFGHLQIAKDFEIGCCGIIGGAHMSIEISNSFFIGSSNIDIYMFGFANYSACYIWCNSSKKISTALTDSSWTSNWAVVNGINNGLPIQKALYHVADAISSTQAQIQSALTGFTV